ncbi:MAG: hypothetical protein NTX61_07455 [Bacteroidetes bacterium]|nr:hypothetical protein [Bacteroidota bacterium]
MTLTEGNKNVTLDRAKFFQSVQVWPLTDDLNYSGWLSNFKTKKEKEIACHILDFFKYYPQKMVDQMLLTSIERAGHYLSKTLPDWKHDDFFDRCYYSYIPGENPHTTDSGHIFSRKMRDVLEIPEARIVDFVEIPKILEGLSNPTPIILVDDFVGSGSQCYNAWNLIKNDYNHKTLKEICESQGHIFIYAPLIVNLSGYEILTKTCTSLICTPCHILGPEYNLFNSECYCWNGDDKLYKDGVKLILKKSHDLGIPSTGGHHTQDEKGFGMQGLALKFEHGAPDAVPSFFYWCHDKWIPLFKKTYTR